MTTDITRNIPRDFKRLIGEKVREECVEILVLIFRANVARNKTPHIEDLLERLQVVELLLRLAKAVFARGRAVNKHLTQVHGRHK